MEVISLYKTLKAYELAKRFNVGAITYRKKGPLLKEKAMAVAVAIRLSEEPEFKVSNSWLDAFQNRHNISQNRGLGSCI